MTLCAALPALAWMLWCKTHFGDLTGSQPKANHLGWTPKPLLQWLPHPLFTPYGATDFINHVVAQFWQGEMVWHQYPLRFELAGWIYTAATIALLATPLARLVLRPGTVPPPQARAFWMAVFMVLSAVAFLVYVSISFDFHDCVYPSRAIPYIFSGRLILSPLIPFMLLWAGGLDQWLGRLPARGKFAVLGLLLVLMLAVEAATNGEAFADSYNWYEFTTGS